MTGFDFIAIFGSSFGVGLLIWVSALGIHMVFQVLKFIIWQ